MVFVVIEELLRFQDLLDHRARAIGYRLGEVHGGTLRKWLTHPAQDDVEGSRVTRFSAKETVAKYWTLVLHSDQVVHGPPRGEERGSSRWDFFLRTSGIQHHRVSTRENIWCGAKSS